MKNGAKKLISSLTVLMMISSFAAAPVSEASGGDHPAAVPGRASKEVGVTVAPPEDITFGQIPGDPSAAQADRGDGTDKDGVFTYRYVGVDGTDHDSEEKPLDAGRYQVVATLNSATHSGEGISAPFTIHKAVSTAKRTITVSTAGGARTVYISELGLYSGMMKGAKIKQEPRIAEGEVLRSGSLTADGAALTLDIKPARDKSSQSFKFVLESDNYQELTVIVTVAVSITADDVEIAGLKVKAPGTFSYGTPLKDMVDLEDCAATVNGQSASGTFALAEPERCYGVGERPEVAIQFTCGGRMYTRAVSADFTIEPVGAVFIGWDEAFIRDGYWITTYANSPYNTSVESLGDLVQDRKQNFTISSDHRRLSLNAVWSADANVPPFDPQGQKPHQVGDIIWYDWYAYTAALSSRYADVKSLSISAVQPKAYIRVVPVIAATDLGGGSKTVSADRIAALTERNWMSALALPKMASVHYEPVEQPAWSDKYVPTPDGTYSITGWQLDGEDLTLAAFKAKAAGAVNGDVELTLTPVYDGVPAWATISSLPAVELTITANERSGQNET